MSISKTVEKIFIFLFLSIVVFWGNIVGNWLPPCKNSDDCGKIVVRIIDADTNEIVEEAFSASIFPIDKDLEKKNRDYYSVKTKNGHFSIAIKPGRYIIALTPYSNNTKYPSYFDPYQPPSDDQIITVEKGKITQITKKVSEGGNLKVILSYPNGQRLNFREHFKIGKVCYLLKNNENGYSDIIEMDEEQMEKGEQTIRNLIPGSYKITVFFDNAGYRKKDPEYIEIEKKHTIEYSITLNPFDNTGINGFVKNKSGVSIKYADIKIYKIEVNDKIFRANCMSNENGYYKIIGLDEGNYKLKVEAYQGTIDIYNIEIKKNKIIEKDIIL